MAHSVRMARHEQDPERSRTVPAAPPGRSGAESVPDSAGGLPLGDASGDHELVRRAQAGDPAAFAVLVERHQIRALRVARNLIADPEEARDLAQEAFLRVFRSLERFDFEHEFSTWLYRIVTNLAIDYLRRRRLVRSTSQDVDEDPFGPELVDACEPAPDRQMDAQETAQRVRACIASLAPHFQSVLVLRELEGLACTSIARIVGATAVTVRWRLHRGRKLFQEEWERRERMAASGLDQRANEPTPFDVDDSEADDSET